MEQDSAKVTESPKESVNVDGLAGLSTSVVLIFAHIDVYVRSVDTSCNYIMSQQEFPHWAIPGEANLLIFPGRPVFLAIPA